MMPLPSEYPAASQIDRDHEREWTRGEEIANSVSHVCGFLAAAAGTPFLLGAATHGQHQHGGWRPLVGMCTFAVTAMLLYFSSATVHWLRPGPAKRFFEVLDHAAIFLLIAGTYTPFALGILWGPWGWLLLALVWPLAIFGVLLKFIRGIQPRRFTISLYVLMGWLMVIAIGPLSARVPPTGLLLILAGGIAYTGGIVFYLTRRVHYHHLAWHLCVLAGSALHYFAVLHYAL